MTRSAEAPAFPHRHLLGIEGLQPWEITFLLDEAEQWVDAGRRARKHDGRLEGLTQINAFFENSTRTLLSFEIAGRTPSASQVRKKIWLGCPLREGWQALAIWSMG